VPDSVTPSNSIAELRARVEARRREEAEALGANVAPEDPAEPAVLTPEFIELCLANNERGDGVLYATLMRDRFLYVKKWAKNLPWLVWRKHHWEIDRMGEHIRAVEQVALVYLKAAEDLVDPISRQREMVATANAKVKAANARAKELAKTEDIELAEVAAVDAEGKQAEAEAASALATYKMLQRKKKEYSERASRLRAKPGAEKCVWWAHHIDHPLAINGDEIDQKRMLLPCPNGVIDLTTGKLHPGKPGDFLLRAIPIEYPEHLGWESIRHYLETGEAFWFEEWSSFIDQLVAPLPNGDIDTEVALCLQKLLGNSITGDVSLHKVVVIVGDGRNGKGVLFRMVQGILGVLSWKIKSELLLDQKQARSTAGPSPEIMALRDRRLVVASETDKYKNISAALVKDFSGGDTINARDMFGIDEENFDPTHHLWLQTNNIPGGLMKEFSLRQRLVLFTFPYMYVDDVELESRKAPHNAKWFRPKDADLETRLSKGREYVLLWLIRGALLAQRDGVAIPAKIRADMEDLQVLEDNLEQFLRTCCLHDYDPQRSYEKGDLVNLPDPADPEHGLGKMYIANVDIDPGENPEDYAAGKWSYRGSGLDPDGEMLFKQFYAPFKAWFEENVNDKKDRIPSSKSVGQDLRKKGYRVESRGGQTKIFADIRILSG
jgi:putative DNA primase/helicase